MGFNWIDWVLVLVISLYGMTGWQEGFHRILIELLTFIGVLWLAIRYHVPAGDLVIEKLGISGLWRDVVGYVAIWMVGEIGLSLILNLIFMKLPAWLAGSYVNRGLGAIFSAARAVVVAGFIMLVATALPLKGTLKADIGDSLIGGQILAIADKYGKDVKTTVRQAAAEVTKFLTVRPDSDESLNLPIGSDCEFKVDPQAETDMLIDVNLRRAEVGVKPLKTDIAVRDVARKHSQDMFDRRYFSHYTPEGTDAGDRLTAGGVKYTRAGENIAYAPDTPTANQGLYDSEGHRRNMLDPEFLRIGVGVIDGGTCGMMFTQNFAN